MDENPGGQKKQSVVDWLAVPGVVRLCHGGEQGGKGALNRSTDFALSGQEESIVDSSWPDALMGKRARSIFGGPG